MLQTSNFVHGSAMSSLGLWWEWVFSKWAWSGSCEQFLHCGLGKFCHSKSSVYRWYTRLVRGRFVYDTYRTMEATRSHHGWVHMFITHWPTLTLRLHNFDLFRTCRTSISALLRGNWQDFNWHDASHGHSVIAELLDLYSLHCCQSRLYKVGCLTVSITVFTIRHFMHYFKEVSCQARRQGGALGACAPQISKMQTKYWYCT